MSMKNHFEPPLSNRGSWEGFLGGWPALIVMQLHKFLPEQYVAEPRVHLGSGYYQDDTDSEVEILSVDPDSSNERGVATAVWAPPQPTLTLELDPTDFHEYEVLIFDRTRGRELVAAIEIVSPANKDRPKSRLAFKSKCAALLQKKICVSIVDLVTVMHFNMYCEVLEMFDETDPAFQPSPPSTYAVTCRSVDLGERSRFESWSYPLSVGKSLPVLPIWLDSTHAISLDLEQSYEQTCEVLRLR
jgi:hypothetical protein